MLYYLDVHKVKITDADLRLEILSKKKNADLLTIDFHVEDVDKEHAHLALIGLLRHVLSGKS